MWEWSTLCLGSHWGGVLKAGVCAFCVHVCVCQKERPVSLPWFRAGILALPRSAGDRGQVSALPVLALGPAFLLQLCWVSWSRPLFFYFFFFPNNMGKSWLGPDVKENTSKTLKMVVVRNHSPVPSCNALPAFQTVPFQSPAPAELSHSPWPQYF